MKLDLTNLSMSINSLTVAVDVYNQQRQINGNNIDLINTLRAGVIQNFEFTYEQCWKFMKRWLELNIGSEVADGVSRRELFRLSAESKLITDVDKWMEFHFSRNITSHTYDTQKASEVLEYSIKFIDYATNLLERLLARNDG
jgi:nucleotidyltransferase substrate binding protein (TIGR01987 family)